MPVTSGKEKAYSRFRVELRNSIEKPTLWADIGISVKTEAEALHYVKHKVPSYADSRIVKDTVQVLHYFFRDPVYRM